MSSTEAPAPGIYHDVPFSEYLEWDAVSNSSLHAATRSMLHYHERQPVEETPAMKLGTLCHAGKFEPLTIPQKYVVMPAYELQVRKPNGDEYDKPKSTAAYKELVASFKKANADKIVVTQHEYDSMLGVVRALANHERASRYLSVRSSTKCEVAIVWRDPGSGLLCKGRMDALQEDIQMIGDLKTTADASDFEKTIWNRRYHRQAAFYIDGLYLLTGDTYDFSLTAVESSAPHGVRSAPLSEDAIEAGGEEYKRLLRQIAEAKDSKVWPGYESPDQWRLPSWAAKAEDDFELVIGGQRISM